MARARGILGLSLDVRVPEWEPLLDLAPEHVGDFMWMFSVRLRDGTRLQAYKHYWTRGYLHLDGDGRAFVYIWDESLKRSERYEEVDSHWLLSRVLDEHLLGTDPDASYRKGSEPVQIAWADSATKHGVSQERAEYVVQRCGLRYTHRADHGATRWDDFRTLFLGEDEEGVALEIAAIELELETFLVFNAMEMRQAYSGLLLRGKGWRRQP